MKRELNPPHVDPKTLVALTDLALEPRSRRMSEATTTGWRRYVGETTVNSVLKQVNASASEVGELVFKVRVEVGAERGIGLGVDHRIAVGELSFCDGDVAPIGEDSDTLQGGFELHNYGFTPPACRRRCSARLGDHSAFIFQTFAVNP